jgi:hypothetical protein
MPRVRGCDTVSTRGTTKEGVSPRIVRTGGELGVIFDLYRPGAVVVEDGFFEKGVIEGFDHLAVTADPRYPERRPNIHPWYELHVWEFAYAIRRLIR